MANDTEQAFGIFFTRVGNCTHKFALARLLRAMCCKATAIECAAGFVCLRAVVVSPQKSFILSGCHVPEDGLIGGDVIPAVLEKTSK